MLENIRIVLVRPLRSGNVGAAARAMKNMGLRDLVIVAPACDIHAADAEGFAARAKDVLAGARVVDAVAPALDGCVLTYAASGKRGPYRTQAASCARDAARHAIATVAAGAAGAAGAGGAGGASGAAAGRVAIAFGPEDRGLVQGELLLFDRVLEIASAAEYPVLNLAAAVMVVCYELHQAWREHARSLAAGQEPGVRTAPSPGGPAARVEPRADDAHKRILYERLFTALQRIGFFSRQQTSDHLKFAIRRVFGRAELSENECDVLIGMASQMHWYVDQVEAGRRPRF